MKAKVIELDEPIDLGVLTIREDECEAILKRLNDFEIKNYPNWSYIVASVPNDFGRSFRVAIARAHGQGTGFAQAMTDKLITDCDPKWIAVVGICGAVPHDEFTLGDVVVATHLHDFSVRARLYSSEEEYSNLGGPMAPDIQNLAANLPALKSYLEGWQNEEAFIVHPPLDWNNDENLRGTTEWNANIRRKLHRHFGEGGTWTAPRVTARTIGSSGELVKDSAVLKQWLTGARDLAGIEMELPGIYRAAAPTRSRRQIPILAIRGISDVVGFERDSRWTYYACQTAAAFFIALLKRVPPSLLEPQHETKKKRRIKRTRGSTPISSVSQTGGQPASVLILQPDEAARAFAEAFNAGDRRIIGSVIETHGYPYLESGISTDQIGWTAHEVLLKLKDGLVDTDAILKDPFVNEAFEKRETDRKERGEGSMLQPPDGTKYTVIDASSPFLDVDHFTVTLQETRYFSVMRARPAIEESPELRRQYGHIDPSRSHVPQSFGLHFIVVFKDTDILTIYRSKDTFPFPETWSFSGEEQCVPLDLAWDNTERMKYFMLRAAVEEVFPLARLLQREKLIEVIERIQPYINSMRIWSLFLEEPTVTFSCFGVFTLDLTVKQYADQVKNFVAAGLGQSSREGYYFSVRFEDALRLVKGESVQANPLFGGKPELLSAVKLHPTSRYRLGRLLTSLGAEV